MNNINLFKVIKLFFGCFFVIFIVWLLKLEYLMVVGVIVLFIVKDIKREIFKGFIGKIYGFFLCIIFLYLCFNILGYNLILFLIFIFIIILFCFLLNI